MLESVVSIAMDLTYNCNLACRWCDRLCGTKYITQGTEHLTIDQLRRYIEIIKPVLRPGLPVYLLGGEPTLHPQLFEILDILVAEVLPLIQIPIQIASNNTGEYVSNIIEQIRSKYSTYTQTKTVASIDNTNNELRESMQFYFVFSKSNSPKYAELTHHPIFRAAQDYPGTKSPVEAYRVCHSSSCNGSTLLTPFGIFICSGSSVIIARIFKLDIGFDHLPTVEEAEWQASLLCKYCSSPCKNIDTYVTCFNYPFKRILVKGATTSQSWELAVAEFNAHPKELTRF